ncbi:MAG: ATP-binding protein [Brachymonas denitrificans]|uniref:sensor histidine kinase n=1 Tax=Brachymonas denitrificans TaxID=28220 RepID=UPI00352D8B84
MSKDTFSSLTRLLAPRWSAQHEAAADGQEEPSVQTPVPVVAGEPGAVPYVVPRWGLNLFWRTFIMIGLLLTMSTIGWLMTIRSLDFEPRATQTAQQIASLVNLSRAALVYSDSITRLALMKTLAEEEGVRILPREQEDRIEIINRDQLDERVTEELELRLGPRTVVASSVNGEEGLWIGFDIDGDAYWLLTDQSRVTPVGGTTWLVWMLMAAGLSLAGAALMAGLVNRPLKQLSIAIGKIRQGDFNAGHLDEAVSTKELREVNIGFNRMAEQMAKVEQERAVMLAGISHDLRTPLARLRLEVEMSVSDEEAQKYMAADIEQVDSIINKFMDYARPDSMQLTTVQLKEVVQTSAYPYLNADDMRLNIQVPNNLRVKADEIELARVVSNLLENARRYGKTPNADYTEVDVIARAEAGYVHLQISDRGAGVPEAMLHRLTQPFYRADEARTSAAGSGLGLSIVKKVVQYMGGTLMLSNRKEGGLQADLRLPRVK